MTEVLSGLPGMVPRLADADQDESGMGGEVGQETVVAQSAPPPTFGAELAQDRPSPEALPPPSAKTVARTGPAADVQPPPAADVQPPVVDMQPERPAAPPRSEQRSSQPPEPPAGESELMRVLNRRRLKVEQGETSTLTKNSKVDIQITPPPPVEDLSSAKEQFLDAVFGVSSAASGAVGYLQKQVDRGTRAKKQSQSLEERLCRRLERISEGGALAVLECQEEQESDSGAEDEGASAEAGVRSVTAQVERTLGELQGLQGSLNDVVKVIKQALDQARSMQSELALTWKQGEAHVPDAKAIADDRLQKHWSRGHGALPEYRRAADKICVRSEWMCSTLLGRHVGEVRTRYHKEIQRQSANPTFFRETLEKLIQKAYSLKDRAAAKAQRDLLSDQNVFEKVNDVYESLEHWKKPIFGVALQVMLDSEEDKNAIVSKLTEVVDHSLHCQQVKVKGFQVIMSHSARLLQRMQGSAGSASSDPKGLDEALTRFYACFQDFLDDHKERAFSAAFLEPALFYFSHSDQGQDKVDNTVPHGINWYLALLNAALGAHLPLQANYSDDAMMFVCDFWHGLKDEAWQLFSKPEHFGRGWQAIPALKQGGKSLVRKKVRPGHLPHDKEVGCGQAKAFANLAVDPRGDLGMRRVLSLYLERFAHFFTRDFFVRRAFEVLNSENKPEHVGFRKACAALFERYRGERADVAEDALLEHLYPDDPYFMNLDVDRTERFLAWLQVVKAPEPNTNSGDESDSEESMACSCQVRFLYNNVDEGVNFLVSMGFGEEQAREAWLACLGTTEAAVGVLMGDGPPPHGLPNGEEPPPPPGQPQCPQQ